MSQLDRDTAKRLLEAYRHVGERSQLSASTQSCDCTVCWGTGKVSVPIIGWTWCGCDKKATPHWGDHDH